MNSRALLPDGFAPQRILLVRLSAIGDILFAAPLLDALRARYPDAELVWLAQPECAPLLRYHPALDALIEWPRVRPLPTLWRALGGPGARLRAYRFDLALDLQGLLKSALPTRLSGAPWRIGLNAREGGGLLMTAVIRAPRDDPRMGSEYRTLAEALGLPTADFVPRLHPGDEAREQAARMIDTAGLQAGFVALCPFTTRAQKHWFEARWAELARRLAEPVTRGGLGLPARLLGAPGDRAAAERIARAAALPLAAWVGETSLPVAAALIERAALVIGVDTGLGHMGVAAGVPSLLLFGATRPYLDTGSEQARVLYHPYPCSPCRRRPSCGGRFDCMRALEVGQILAQARDVLPGAGS